MCEVGEVVRNVSVVLLCPGNRLSSWQSLRPIGLNMVSTKQRAYSNKTVANQAEGQPRNVYAQVFGCRECLSLLLPGERRRESTFVKCEQLEMLSLVVELKKEVKRLSKDHQGV